ncbi:mitotic checkpoint protein BUB3 [Euwallacea similis]|uniref:mitotic checkpoint protein BUB3 n=1 Tax=Euwallacea similis TaxID=1736056 RepID=UPI00344DC514
MQSQAEYKLKSPPDDAISSVKFGPNTQQFLLVSSWDSYVRLYDVNTNSLRHKYAHDNAVLDCCFTDAVHSYSGGLDSTLKSFDFNTTTESIVGTHNNSIKCVVYCNEFNCILTGSWDEYVKIWDPRSSGPSGTYKQCDKVLSMDTCGEKLLVATAGRKVLVWDIRNMAYTLQKRETSLKYQTRAIRAFPNGQGFVLSSIEGRVAVEYLDTNPEIQKKKYAFKCHRIKEDGMEKIYPVNAISFHPIHNTFATGGSDGYVNVWDGFNKKRLCQFHQYHTSITSLSFSSNGSTLAISTSYFLEEDNPPNPLPEDSIYIRSVTDQETKPKYSSNS